MNKIKTFLSRYPFIGFNLIFDVLVITFVMTFNFNPVRLVLFYWLDTNVMIFFMMLFLKFTGWMKYNYQVLINAALLILINFIFFPFICELFYISVNKELSFDFIQLLYPYFDLSIFLMISGIANMYFYKRIKSLKDNIEPLTFFVFMNSFYSMILVPAVLLLAVIMMAFTGQILLSIVVSFILLRNLMDYYRIRNIRKIEMPLKLNVSSQV
jgi:hypothetical protein